MVKKYAEAVGKLNHERSFGEHRVLKIMSDLFALHGIVESPGDFLEASSLPWNFVCLFSVCLPFCLHPSVCSCVFVPSPAVPTPV